MHSLHTVFSSPSSELNMCCLKVDMSNAFNECSHSSFLSRYRLSFLLGYSGVIVVQGSYTLDFIVFYQLLVFSKVILWDPFFLLVLLEYLSVHPSPDGLLYQPWYFDDGALVFFSATLASFLDVLQHDAHGFGVCPNLSKCQIFWPTGNQFLQSSIFR